MKQESKRCLLSLLVGMLVLGLGLPALAMAADGEEEESNEAPANLAEALKGGTFSLSFRYRFEAVEDDAPSVRDNTGLASTLRTTLKYEMLPFHGVSFLIEAEDIHDLGLKDRHNNKGAGDLWNGVSDYPVIADPALTEINQGFLRIAPGGGFRIQAGREEVNLDNHRFVGNVGWRQNHQSFDAGDIQWSWQEKVTLRYLYVGAVNRIFGDRKPMKSHLLNARFGLWQGASVVLYGYLLDYSETKDAGFSRDSYGARLQGTWSVGDGWKIPYAVEGATQRDSGDNPNRVSANYYHGDVRVKRSGWQGGVGFEILEGSPGDGAFATPLATLHKFNGWADKFLSTPANGLVDVYLLVGWGGRGISALAVYHDFKADTGGDRWGKELDLQVTYKAPWKQSFGLKFAFYDADVHAFDTKKAWLWTGYSF